MTNKANDSIEKYIEVNHLGNIFKVVNPKYFYSRPVEDMGLGLFCKIDLEIGDIWWAHILNDPRYVEKIYSWQEYLRLEPELRREIELKCYVIPETREIVVCTEPFCRVNHGNKGQFNSDSDTFKNSLACKRIKANDQILISYEYEAIISLVWKFDEFRSSLSEELLNDDNFLFQEAINSKAAMDFLIHL